MDLEYEDAGGDGHRCPDTGEEKTSCRVPVKEELLSLSACAKERSILLELCLLHPPHTPLSIFIFEFRFYLRLLRAP